jgi:hypothetical protein
MRIWQRRYFYEVIAFTGPFVLVTAAVTALYFVFGYKGFSILNGIFAGTCAGFMALLFCFACKLLNRISFGAGDKKD